MMPDYKHYSMVIQWSNEDQLYLVTVPELPGCITHGKTYEEAVKQGQDAIETWLDAAIDLKWTIPPPRIADISAV
jgi:predicted RNase H-like HicB family nuclease